MRPPESKLFTNEQLLAWRKSMRDARQKVVMTNGCYDLTHRGHVEYLSNARKLGDALLVAVNSDSSIHEIKGPDRPVIPEADRAFLIASLEVVDAVFVFSDPDVREILSMTTPDIYVKGGDYTLDTINQDERILMDELDIEIAFLPIIEGYSTSYLIEKIQSLNESS
jgi:D-glycero-beta-D-manno-heptose 1-phosphate adenylyltransferase